jgi:hypothetical protein
MIIGNEDEQFFRHDPETRTIIRTEVADLRDAYRSAEALLAFSCAHNAEYVVVPKSNSTVSLGVEAMVYEDRYNIVYDLGKNDLCDKIT